MPDNSDRIPAIIPVKFETEYVPDPDPSQPMRAIDRVWWVKKGEGGNGAQTSEAISRLKPGPRQPNGAIEWAVVGPAYEAWKRGEEAPTSGTPLSAWPGCTRAMADELKKLNIRTVEDLAGLADHHIGKVPLPNLRDVRTRAKAFVAATGATDIANQLAKRDTHIDRLESLNEDMAARLAEMEAQMKALAAGRPAQVHAEHDDDDEPGEVLVGSEFEMDPDAPPPIAPAGSGRHRGGGRPKGSRVVDGRVVVPEA